MIWTPINENNHKKNKWSKSSLRVKYATKIFYNIKTFWWFNFNYDNNYNILVRWFKKNIYTNNIKMFVEKLLNNPRCWETKERYRKYVDIKNIQLMIIEFISGIWNQNQLETMAAQQYWSVTTSEMLYRGKKKKRFKDKIKRYRWQMEVKMSLK